MANSSGLYFGGGLTTTASKVIYFKHGDVLRHKTQANKVMLLATGFVDFSDNTYHEYGVGWVPPQANFNSQYWVLDKIQFESDNVCVDSDSTPKVYTCPNAGRACNCTGACRPPYDYQWIHTNHPNGLNTVYAHLG